MAPAGPPAATRDAAAAVEWLGALQAQDLGSGLWSLGVRLPGARLADVEAAVERGEVLRTWPMRGTIHWVPPRDVGWMLEVLGSRTLAGSARRRQQLGLDDATADRAVDVLGEAVTGAGRLTRAQCVEALAAAGITATGGPAYHLLWYASQRGVLCLGPNRGTEQTFVPLAQWAPDQVSLDRDAALAEIAVRYLRSHGPTTAADLAGWTGLTLRDARRGIAAAGDALACVEVDGVPCHADPALLDLAAGPAGASAGVHALPGFDEFLLGYKDRSLMLRPGDLDAVVPGGNGVFRPTLSDDGQVVATWRRTATARAVRIEVLPLREIGPATRRDGEAALTRYADFLGRTPVLSWP